MNLQKWAHPDANDGRTPACRTGAASDKENKENKGKNYRDARQNPNIKFAGEVPLITTQRPIPGQNYVGTPMDVSAIASLATEMSQNQTAQAVQIAVLKKAMDIEAQSAMQLLEAVPSNPPNLGNNVDLFA